MKTLIAALIFVLSACALQPALAVDSCPPQTSEQRIIEALTPEDKYQVIEGTDLDLFIKNTNELYNIGWVREQIARVWVIEAVAKHKTPDFQAVHLFFIGTDGCIRWYQGTYAVVVRQLLDPDPMGKRVPAPEAENYYKPTQGAIIIEGVDPGGNLGTYAQWWERIAASGVKVIVNGQCISACALIFGIVPRENVCLTPHAAFGLHMASLEGQPDSDITYQMIRLWYPEEIQRLVEQKGGLNPELIWLYPEDLVGFYRMCDEGESAS